MDGDKEEEERGSFPVLTMLSSLVSDMVVVVGKEMVFIETTDD